MKRAFLVHWHAAELAEREAALRGAGFAVTSWSQEGSGAAATLKSSPPDVAVIDLGRLPSHGRHIAVWLREHKSTRHVPLVFVAGDPAKVDSIRALFPDATYATWRGIRAALRRALARPATDPIAPTRTAGYSGTPLPKKLGIAAGASVACLGAPRDFRTTLGDLPQRVKVATRLGRNRDVIVLFVDHRAELESRLPAAITALAERGGLWIAWPKQASGVPTDLSENRLRELVLPLGLVDNKVCAIDATWSGLRFVRRRAKAVHR